MNITPGQIKKNYEKVLNKIELAAHSVGRDPSEIKLVVVTKTHPVEVIDHLYALGVRDFGENRTDEAINKINALSERTGVQWHMIGHVQSRKAELVCEHFNYLHSLDRLKLAARLSRFAVEKNSILPVLLQVNVSGEQSKSGWMAADKTHWDVFMPDIEAVLELPNLDVRGLMTMAPFGSDPENARPVFVQLRRFRDHLAAKFPDTNWQELSMGMRRDYQVAVQEGATFGRIGSEILGSR